MKLKLLMILLLFVTYSRAGNISIAVAANVSYAIGDLIKSFNVLYPQTKVRVTLGGSGKLTAQIKNGAPYQFFMSADMKYPKALYEEGLAVTRPLVYAQGSLAYLSTKNQDFSQGMKVLENVNIEKIAVANPKTAPYGKASFEAMKNAAVLEKVQSKLVYGESISQAVSYVITAADIGLIAKSSLYSPKMAQYKEGIHWAEVDPELYTSISQGMVILKNAEANAEVSAFYTFMLSAKAKEILTDFGYVVP
jgi:molybdate transport system substrate-binding protein